LLVCDFGPHGAGSDAPRSGVAAVPMGVPRKSAESHGDSASGYRNIGDN
jgi:hypothetical protein